MLDKAFKEAETREYKKNVDLCRLAFDWYVAEVTHEEELARDLEGVKKRNIRLYKKLKNHKIESIGEGKKLAEETEVNFYARPHEWRRK